MKEKLTKKRRRILSLFAAAMLATFGGTALLKTDNALAQNADTVQTKSLVAVSSGASVGNESGVRISSDSAYSAELKGKFEGDTTLKFRFPETHTDWFGGDFKVRVADATDESNYFEVYYRANTDPSSYNHTQGYVLYNGQIRSSKYFDSSKQYYNAYQGWGNAIVAPAFRSWYGNGANATRNVREGILSFVWTDDVLSVQMNNCATPENRAAEMRTVAAFDGSEEFVAKDTPSWGLPKLDFENGYIISVSSSFTNVATTDKGTDVLFTSIENGGEVYDLRATELPTPSFYTEYEQWKAENPSVDEKITELVQTTATVSTTNGLYISSDEAYEATLNGTFYGNTSMKFYFPETVAQQEVDKNKEAGNKSYVDWYGGNFVVRVTDATDESNYFEVEYGAMTDKWGYSYTNAWVKYKGAYYTTSYDNSAVNWYNSRATGVLPSVAPSFRGYYGRSIVDRMGYLGFEWDGDGKLSVIVNRAAGATSANRALATFDGTIEKGFEKGVSWGLPKLNFENGYKISFSSEFVNKGTTDKATDVCFSEIAGVDFSAADEVTVNYQFATEFENATVKGNDVYIPQNEQIGDITAVYTRYFAGKGWYERETVDMSAAIDTATVGTKSVVIEGDAWAETPLGKIEKTYTLHVETRYTLTFDTKGGASIQTIVHSANTTERVVVQDAEKLFWQFDGWYEGTELFDGNVAGLYNRSAKLTAAWKDVTPPVISLAEGVAATSVQIKNQSVTLSKADVAAGDSAQNESVTVSIAWKKADGEYTEVADGYTLLLNEAGTYSVRYTVTDGAALTAETVREIRVIERLSPVLSAAAEYKQSEYVGSSVSVVTVTAQDADGKALDVAVIISRDGEKIEIKNGKFELIKLGTYQITYTATDEYGLVGLLAFALEVVEDNEPPVITVDFEDKNVEKGTVITLPTAQVSDNVNEGASVSVKVSYGTQNIPLENNSFKANTAGTYTVTYVAVDRAGNMSQAVFYVTVKAETNANEDNKPALGCGAGCNGSGGAELPLGMLLFMGSVLFGKNLMMKKLKRKENR